MLAQRIHHSKIAEMVDEAANSKAPIARLADKVSGIFVPTVMILSALTFIVWLLIGKPWNFALERGISVLVISCPCALGLATPISIMVATGVAAKNKILLKNAAALETLHSVKVAAIDKTGTITTGELRVDRAVSSDDRFYSVLGALESSSSHPLALAVTDYLRENSIPFGSAENSLTVPGKGIEAKLDGKDYRCGNRKFIEEWGVNTGDVDTEGGSVIFAADKRKLLGYVIISDTVKESSAEASRNSALWESPRSFLPAITRKARERSARKSEPTTSSRIFFLWKKPTESRLSAKKARL